MKNHRRKKSTTLKATATDLITASPTSSSSSSNNNVNSSLNNIDNNLQLSVPNPIEPLPRSTFRSRCEDVVVLFIVFLGFACLSIFVGAAAGISISIHYFETEGDHRHLILALFDVPGYGPPGALHQRLTNLDPIIASSNRWPTTAAASTSSAIAAAAAALNNPLVEHQQRVIYTTPDGHKTILMVVDEIAPIDNHTQPVPVLPRLEDLQSIPPRLCSDGITWGYDSWSTLRTVVDNTNRYAYTKAVRWHEYFQQSSHQSLFFDDDALYYDDPIRITLCPNTVFHARGSPPLYINTPSLTLSCPDATCQLRGSGSHISFGSFARAVTIRGITFRLATHTSLLVYEHGADVAMEECTWHSNRAVRPTWGAVADVNASSAIHFYRCFVGNQPQSGGSSGVQASSLSIRQA